MVPQWKTLLVLRKESCPKYQAFRHYSLPHRPTGHVQSVKVNYALPLSDAETARRGRAVREDVSPFGDSPAANLDDFSISMTNSITTIDDSLLQGLEEDDDNTVTRETRDRRIMQLQVDDDEYYGDGGTSDADGMGFEDVDGFREEMLDASQDRLTNGEEDVEEGILDTEENATQFLGTTDRRGKQLSTLYGAPAGWMPPGPEEGWLPKQVNANKGEVAYSLSDEESEETSKTKTKKKGSGGKYLHHAMPCGAIPVPEDGTTAGKRM